MTEAEILLAGDADILLVVDVQMTSVHAVRWRFSKERLLRPHLLARPSS